MILYYAPTACSIAPHIALEETGIPFEPRALDLAKGDHLSTDYLAVNPAGRVPALIVDGRLITEVPALLTYIAGLSPQTALVPEPGTLDHARCFEWLGFLSSTLHVAYAQFRRPQRFLEPGSPCTDELSSQGKDITIGYYREVERRLDGRWAAGEHYSIADIYLFPFFTWAWRLEFDIERECPKWTDLFRRVKARPAAIRALEREGLTV
jgi:glutathione S-transferase